MMTNKQLADELKALGDLLIIGGYEETHAARYARIAYTISRMTEEAENLCREGRLCEIPGVGPTIAALISEYLATGTCAKRRDFERRVPASVLELLTIPGLGAKTARSLYNELGIDSLAKLEQAVYSGSIALSRGLGARTASAIRRHLAGNCASGLFAEREALAV